MNPTARTPADRRTAEEGFTLIELLIVMSIMLILMALIVPQVTRMKKTANQTSAVQSMRAIGQAEIGFNSAFPTAGYACTLQALGGDPKSGAPSAQAAQLLDPQLAATGQKSGYTFAITNCTKVTVNNQDTYTSYQVTAVPQAPGKTGDLGYCSDENNIIKADPAGGTNCTQPIQ
ncbi:MAG: type II secretion system GspH family protein [Acidobacteriota bacterium]|nr:type II secretion system GspH family protein [Acidobacteriota bacterium]